MSRDRIQTFSKTNKIKEHPEQDEIKSATQNRNLLAGNFSKLLRRSSFLKGCASLISLTSPFRSISAMNKKSYKKFLQLVFSKIMQVKTMFDEVFKISHKSLSHQDLI